jgi:succinate dehydrogenase/fumarate reductase iron-sulfur protein
MVAEAGKLSVRVFRFDPSVDVEPYYDSFIVPYDEQETLLGVLKYIVEHHDPSLAFRESCRIGNCVICTVRANGRRMLACRQTLRDLGTDELTIEPAYQDRVIRDLVCEM